MYSQKRYPTDNKSRSWSESKKAKARQAKAKKARAKNLRKQQAKKAKRIQEYLFSVKQLKELLSDVSKETNKATQTILSKEDEIRDHCSELRTKVNTQSETIIEEVNKWNVEMLKKIDDYEKDCLDKFNPEEFEASASILKSLLLEMNDHQKEIEQQINDAEKVNEMIDRTQTILQDLKKEQKMARKSKFSNNVLNLSVDVRAFNPSMLTNFVTNVDTASLSRMQHIRTIRDMPDFERLEECFINPFATSFELIAIYENKYNKTTLIKMNGYGKVLNEKVVNQIEYISYIQTANDYFIFQHSYPTKWRRFDYDFKELEMTKSKPRSDQQNQDDQESETDFDTRDRDATYTVNARAIFTHTYDIHDMNMYSHDMSVKRKLYSIHNDGPIHKMLVNENHLYIWSDKEVCTYDIEDLPYTNASKHWNLGELCAISFERDFDYVKLLGDQYIAVFNSSSNKVSIFTQDSKLDFVKEFILSDCEAAIDDEAVRDYGALLRMSTDRSDGLCFFNSNGDIYHNLF